MSDARRPTADVAPGTGTVGPWIALAGYHGDLPGLTRALRSGTLAPHDVDLLAVVTTVLTWFDDIATRDLDLASVALPQAAAVVEIKARLLLPTIPRHEDVEDEEVPDVDPTASAIRVLEELEDAIDFLRLRRLERRVVVHARAPKPDLPRPYKRLGIDVQRLKAVASALRPGAYFELVDDRWTLLAAMRRLRAALSRLTGGVLSRLIPTSTWEERTITFAAFLELVRVGDVEATQDEPYDDIQVSWRGRSHSS